MALMFGVAGSLWCIGCKTESPKVAPPTPAVAPKAEIPKPPLALDLASLKKQAENVALSPSPAEMQLTLQKAGIQEPLGKIVRKKVIATNVPSRDQVAVRTGVVIADLVLTVKVAPKEDTLLRLARIKEGMGLLGAGTDIDAMLVELSARISNDALKGDDLVRELDELSGAVIPEVEFQAGPRVVPLIQAGSWLEGANLVSTAMRNAARYDAADQLLRQPDVVRYFLNYVKSEGQASAPDEVIKKLEQTLQALQTVTEKPKLEQADVITVQTSTDSVLALL
jgi:hypothetical protein